MEGGVVGGGGEGGIGVGNDHREGGFCGGNGVMVGRSKKLGHIHG